MNTMFFYEHCFMKGKIGQYKLVFGACVAAVKCHSVLQHCVLIFFWFSGTMGCTLFTFKKRVHQQYIMSENQELTYHYTAFKTIFK